MSFQMLVRPKYERKIQNKFERDIWVLKLYHAKECCSNIQIPLIKKGFASLRDILAHWQNYSITSSRQTHHHAYTIELITMVQVQSCTVE
ncbi:unnamed protein product [Brugia pahangi]|uniref:Transposase n=1 Tax=Brugia pahangi TaxID=6280 RepID=A0A0N4TYX2_BRUPA|nr:unnamed protein product [Brugia pahangi]